MVRRPDLVIVNNPCLPPAIGNIERVAEFKFGADLNDQQQNAAYQRIAGSNLNNYAVYRVGGPPQNLDETEVDCGKLAEYQTVKQDIKKAQQAVVSDASVMPSIDPATAKQAAEGVGAAAVLAVLLRVLAGAAALAL